MAHNVWRILRTLVLAAPFAGLAAGAEDRIGSSEGSAAALYRLGLIQSDPLRPEFDLSKASATFLDVARLYPESPEAPEAIFAAGECHLLLGGRMEALADDVRLVVAYPSSDSALRARLRLAPSAAILGERNLADQLLQPLLARAGGAGGGGAPAGPVDRGSGSGGLGGRARQLEALLVRSREEDPAHPGSRSFDSSFLGRVGARRIGGVAAGRDGDVKVVDAGSGAVFKLGQSEAVIPGSPEGERPRGIAMDREGGVFLWGESGITLPDGSRFEPRGPAEGESEGEPLRRIRGIAIGPLGEIDVLDGAGDRVLRYGRDLRLRGVVATAGAHPTAAVRTNDGTLYLLVESRREILVVPAGAFPPEAPELPAAPVTQGARATRVISLRDPGPAIESPVALATDDLDRLYILDASTRRITILDREGQKVAEIAPEPGSPGELRSPVALAVDAAGNVYVADRRQGLVLRFK